MSRRTFWGICVVIFVVALGLRLITLQGRSLQMDEAYSVWFAARPWHELWHVVPLYEIHPPMYYSLLKVWIGWFGDSEVAVRVPSVIVSMATVLLVAVSGKLLRAGPVIDRVGLIAGLLLATNKGSIMYGQLARPYAFEALAVAVALLCAVIVLRHVTANRAPDAGSTGERDLYRPALVGLALSVSATLWSHNTGLLVAFFIGLGMLVSVLCWARGNRLVAALTIGAPFVVALALWSPYVSFLIAATKYVQSSFWVKLEWIDFLKAWSLAAGARLTLLPVLILCAGAWLALWRTCRPVALFLAMVLFLPFAFIVAYSCLVRPIFMDRLFVWMAAPMMFLTALGLAWALPRSRTRLTVLVLLLLLSGVQLVQLYRGATEDFRASVAEVANNRRSGDLLIVSPNEVDIAVQYYAKQFRDFPDVLVVPSPFPAIGLDRPYLSNVAAPGIVPADRDMVRAAIATHGRVWLIQRNAGGFDPDSVVRNEILSLRKPVQVHDEHTPELRPELFE
ncbi:glycosyltransferase family 39 protein [Caballeronia hypogeia]|uniref:glycosyltransferase family 39 protein n=1 Tax=Caballeronia hypogeia TaxID=1777140 RepID=UPI00077244DE|nr:glycosyltransferase family 39 protein [Caballeronia hypogeia]